MRLITTAAAARAEDLESSPFVEVDSVSLSFRQDSRVVHALDNVSLSLPKGSFSTLIGPSGCGKSTLLRVIADIYQPQSGSIRIEGLAPSEARRGQRIGFVFQESTLLPWRTVIDNIALPLEIVGASSSRESLSPQALVQLVGLSGFEQAKPHQLSGGMQQRVSIARSLVLRPDLLLLDEPFGALDEITRQKMNVELLRIWGETGTTALLVTHNIGEAVFMSDAVHVMSARPGKILRTVPVDLPRPRSIAQMQSPLFAGLQGQVRELLFS